GVVISVVPAIVRDVFGGGVTQVSIYRGLIIVGLAVGATVMSILGNTLPVQLAVLVSLAGAGFWMVLLAIAAFFKIGGGLLVGLCLFGTGGAGAALLVSITATIQHLVPDARRGRVFGVSDMFTMGAMVTASGILGLAPIPNLDRYVPLLIALVAVTLVSACVMSWFTYTRATHLRAETWFLWKFISFASAFWWRTRRDGRCTVPGNGPVILAANHTAGIDPLVQIASSNGLRFPAYIVADEYYKPAKWFMDLIGCIPIDRKNPGKAFYVAALKHLKGGGCLGIFPQGTFERPGEETPEGKSGVGLIALRTGALIIPCHISGTRYFDNPFAALFFRHKVRIKYGPPIDTRPFVGRERDKAAAEELADLIMQKIQELAPKA
ncbi:MAG: 1-acyl-sn-glycerol-3-phosphate acyltransferase, partial [Phycisphaerae bacterium]